MCMYVVLLVDQWCVCVCSACGGPVVCMYVVLVVDQWCMFMYVVLVVDQ